MSSIRYPGVAGRGASLLSRGQVDAHVADVKVTNTYVQARLLEGVQANGTLISKAEMTTTLSSYVDSDQRDTAMSEMLRQDQLDGGSIEPSLPGYSGLPIKLGADGKLTNAQIGRSPVPYMNASGPGWASSIRQSQPVAWTNLSAQSGIGTTPVQVGVTTIYDPGFPYVVLLTGYLEVKADASSPDSRLDIEVHAGSATGPIIASGSAPPGFSAYTPLNIVPQAHERLLGTVQLFVMARKGYGNGTSSFSNYQARWNVLALPA
ncbi:structural protein [Rhodococcus phage E3]|uniref:minor tail protein n=1 Tax=Rhodococcus phage E3 TaxID=1007869 RepID=UPI0002C699EB|nr:minor tail protein [Rhodococcus phage E3]AEQ21128.1 structural protein [Rhodococcus phage E3]